VGPTPNSLGYIDDRNRKDHLTVLGQSGRPPFRSILTTAVSVAPALLLPRPAMIRRPAVTMAKLVTEDDLGGMFHLLNEVVVHH
jgi:hypothetical protein